MRSIRMPPTNNRVSNRTNNLPRPKLFTEMGNTGLKTQSGWIFEEFLRVLRGSQGRKTFQEMADNDPTIGSILFAIQMMFRRMEWKIESSDSEMQEDETQQEIIQFVKSVLFQDMEQTWDETLTEILSMLVYGWSYHEIVLKRRMGKHSNPFLQSRFDDGKIGFKILSPRSQHSLYTWEIDERGGGILKGMWQQSELGSLQTTFIPIEKSLLFRPSTTRNNPEGRSVLRNAYVPWYYKKNIQNIEAIGIERDLNGLPVVLIPSEILGSDETEDTSLVQEYNKLVKHVRLNSEGGIVLPSDLWKDDDGKLSNQRKVELKLLSTEGRRAIDTKKIKDGYDRQILMSVLADFIMLGTQEVGSRSLGESKIDLFLNALYGWAESIVNVFNNKAIPLLMSLNGIDQELWPKLNYGTLEPEDLGELGQFIKDASAAGMELFPDVNLNNHLRERAGLPQMDEDLAEMSTPEAMREEEELNRQMQQERMEALRNQPQEGLEE